jgi:DNA-binding NtrC family response regulator
VKTLSVDVRLVTATNIDLHRAIADGRFREDLFYRLNVVPVHLPPLRNRRDDIALLADHFLDYYNRRLDKSVGRVSPDAMAALTLFRWPGNIRQLENVLERTVLFCDNETIERSDLPQELRSGAEASAADPVASAEAVVTGGVGLKDVVKQHTERVERESIVRVLGQTGGNVTRCAKLLKISRKSLQNKMKEFGLREGARDQRT